MQRQTDACVRSRPDTWRAIHSDTRKTENTCWMEPEEQTKLMLPSWWRKNNKDLVFCRGCAQLIILIKLIKGPASCLCDTTKRVAVVHRHQQQLAPPPEGVLFSCSLEHVDGPTEHQIQQETVSISFENIWAKHANSSDVDSEWR